MSRNAIPANVLQSDGNTFESRSEFTERGVNHYAGVEILYYSGLVSTGLRNCAQW
jgi:hypothetical protein